jgi:hypothetical protein
MAWRNCNASLTLVAAVNARWPQRDRRSDGTIGDAVHATRNSDHNPHFVVNGIGVVRARDIDVDGVEIAWLFEELRKLGAAGDPRLAGGGYLILNRRITAPDFRSWRVYTGSNPHTSHGHVSFSLNPAGFDSQAPWPFLGRPSGGAAPARATTAAPAPAPKDEDEMSGALHVPLPAGTDETVVIPVPPIGLSKVAPAGHEGYLTLLCAYDDLLVHSLNFTGPAQDGVYTDLGSDRDGFVLRAGVPHNIRLPNRCVGVEVIYNSSRRAGALIEWCPA